MESQERSRLIKRTIRADDRSGRSPFNHIFEAIACGKTGFFMKNMLRLFLLLLLHVTAIPLKLKKVIPWWLLTLLPPENLKKYDFLDSSNSTNFIREPQMQKSIDLDIIRKLTDNSLEKGIVPFLRYCCSKLGRCYDLDSRSQVVKGSKFEWKTKKNVWLLLKLLEKLLPEKLTWFSMVFDFFWFCLTLSVPKKLKSMIFEILIIPQILNIDN